MTQTTSRLNSGNTILPPRLGELLEEDKLDWDDPRHREAYLRYWLHRPLAQQEEALNSWEEPTMNSARQ